ncbi:hypothetical protein PIB30_059578 [Stylosanthes scabra]|uniref:Uncharacterized protein n=1 Tax=Stylosanthes scabra TaxID=79078 RepID=A0ABU6SKM2_9FABA|nr:hypothetical protein [Stylosanthes scabra]
MDEMESEVGFWFGIELPNTAFAHSRSCSRSFNNGEGEHAETEASIVITRSHGLEPPASHTSFFSGGTPLHSSPPPLLCSRPSLLICAEKLSLLVVATTLHSSRHCKPSIPSC